METFFSAIHQLNTLEWELIQVQAGESIFRPGDEADCVYFIVEGIVKISALNADQKEVTKGIYGKGDLFGEQAITGDDLRIDWAIALQETTLHVLSARNLLELLHGRKEQTMLLMKLIADRRTYIEQRLESLVFRDSRSRVIECIVQMISQKGQHIGYEWVLYNPISHQEIANLTATSRQTVTTTLNDLRYAKILIFNRKRFLVRDLNKLIAEIKS